MGESSTHCSSASLGPLRALRGGGLGGAAAAQVGLLRRGLGAVNERAAGGRLRAELRALGEGRPPGQMQISAELVPIPDASGCVGMRRDFEFQQISPNSRNSGKI